MHFIYLHGFASSPRSSKAVFFGERLAAQGLTLHTPDFNLPEFESLTVTRMLRQLEAVLSALPPDGATLIGSSLGGFVAVEAAARANDPKRPIAQLILLAPAVVLEWDRWSEVGPGGIERWRAAGGIDVFHYADDTQKRLGFAFYEDAVQYAPASRRLPMPMQIFQGRFDDTVDPDLVRRFAEAQPAARLHLLDDGHQLKESLEYIWREIDPARHGAGLIAL